MFHESGRNEANQPPIFYRMAASDSYSGSSANLIDFGDLEVYVLLIATFNGELVSNLNLVEMSCSLVGSVWIFPRYHFVDVAGPAV